MGGGERGTVNGISSAFTRIEAQLDGVKGAYREIFHEVLCRPSAMGGVKKGSGYRFILGVFSYRGRAGLRKRGRVARQSWNFGAGVAYTEHTRRGHSCELQEWEECAEWRSRVL